MIDSEESTKDWTAEDWIIDGNRYYMDEDYAKAINYYSRALKINPNCKMAWNRKKAALQKLKRTAEYNICQKNQKAVNEFTNFIKMDRAKELLQHRKFFAGDTQQIITIAEILEEKLLANRKIPEEVNMIKKNLLQIIREYYSVLAEQETQLLEKLGEIIDNNSNRYDNLRQYLEILRGSSTQKAVVF